MLVSDSVTLRDLWTRAVARLGSQAPGVPDVDFTKHLVIVVALGETVYGDIAIDSVRARGFVLLEVFDHMLLQGAGICTGYGEWFRPADIVQVPRTVMKTTIVAFRDTIIRKKCWTPPPPK